MQAMTLSGIGQKRCRKQIVETCFSRLLKKDYLTRDDSGHISVSPKGERYLNLLELKDYKIQIPKRWDGKWRVISFDIPERMKKVREYVRIILSDIGFIRMQDRVWVYPYECQELITLLKFELGLASSITYIRAEYIENENKITKQFKIQRS